MHKWHIKFDWLIVPEGGRGGHGWAQDYTYKIVYRLIATVMNDYQELLNSYVAQNNGLQVRGPNVLIQGSSSVEFLVVSLFIL